MAKKNQGGAENASAENASAENAGAENAGAENASAENASAENASAENASAENASAENAGAENASAENAGAENAGAETAGAETASAAGDLKKALSAARAELRIQRSENERLKTTVGKRFPAEGKPPEDKALDTSPFTITQEDLDKSDVEAINKKQTALIEAVSQQSAQAAVDSMRHESQAKSTVDDLLSRYEIFADADEELATAAETQALLRLNSLPDKAGMAEVEATVEAVVKQFSQYKVAKSKNDAPESGTHPLAVGAGTSEAAHMQSNEPRPKSDKEAKALGSKLARRIAKAKGLLWD